MRAAVNTHGGARPKRRPTDQRGGPRPGSGPKPAALTLVLGKEALQTLRLLATADGTSVEALAAGWVLRKLDREWEAHSQQVSCLLEEWGGEIL